MATQITNRAVLNYTSNTSPVTVNSNIASVTMQGPLEVTKYSLEDTYMIGETVTYNVFITNTSAATLTNLTITDDLGTYAISTIENVTPLTYIGPAKIFVNNVFSGTVTGVVSAEADSVTFTIASLASGSTLLLEYNTTVNQYAGATIGTSQIENIVSVNTTGFVTPIIATNTLPVGSYADVVISKSMSPDPVIDGSTLTYTFNISNYGTIAATDVTLQDVFSPTPSVGNVTVDGTVTTEYSYVTGIFLYPAASSAVDYTIPAATFTQNPTTGVVTVVPGTSTVVIQGTI